jgi:AbrB family looped-hinge helix DNA binding protein
MEKIMNTIATTKLSSRGQIVIPEEIRNQMHLHTGDQFVVFAEKDVVILKMVTRPNDSEFKSLIDRARVAAKQVGLSKNDVAEAVKEARKK